MITFNILLITEEEVLVGVALLVIRTNAVASGELIEVIVAM